MLESNLLCKTRVLLLLMLESNLLCKTFFYSNIVGYVCRIYQAVSKS